MGKSSRDKGAQAEREVARLWREVYPEARRTGQDQAHQATTKPGDVYVPGWCIEVKRRRAPEPGLGERGLGQAELAAAPGDIPVCCHRADRRPWEITMRLSDLAGRVGAEVELLYDPPVTMELSDFLLVLEEVRGG